MDDVEDNEEFTPFRYFTRASLASIEDRIKEEKQAQEEELKRLAAEEAAAESDEDEETGHHDEPLKPNPKLEAGMKLPPTLEDYFKPCHIGRPLEDIDEYYQNKTTFVVIGKDKTIYRFSATNGFFVVSPFNIVRRAAIYLLVHPMFSLLVILTIIVNCIFMTFTETPGGENTDLFSAVVILTIIANCVFMTLTDAAQITDVTEYVFTAIYTVESLVKMTARGFILQPFTYLRDPWNWLDFGVIAIAYLTMVSSSLGNLSALRTFRVLRALKTVAVVPGLKTIVGALLEAVIRLRDVGILTSFMLSIFALIGMQLYMGSLRHKCVKNYTLEFNSTNITHEEYFNFVSNETNWWMDETGDFPVCSNASTGGKCGEEYVCIGIGDNPNFGYTSFDNFGYALLCAFRLMTQDYWENLYMLVLRAEGLWHSVYFILVILMGSFYLVNLILAIVAMSYDEQDKADKADADEKAAIREELERGKKEKNDELVAELDHMIEEITKSPSIISNMSETDCKGDDGSDRQSIKSETHSGDLRYLGISDSKASLSLPGSPDGRRRRKLQNRLSIKLAKTLQQHAEKQPLVNVDSINLPYADDSNAVTPCSDDIRLCNIPSKFSLLEKRRASMRKPLEGNSRRGSYASLSSRHSQARPHSPRSPDKLSKLMEAFERKHHKGHHLSPDIYKGKHGDHETSDSSDVDISKRPKGICRTPRASVDPQDVLELRELIDHVETALRRKSGFSGSYYSSNEKEPLKNKVYRLMCSWDTPPWFKKLQGYVGFIILDAFVDLFITLCILANTAFMALDMHGMSESMASFLESGNQVFSAIFAVEAFLKIIALGFMQYMKDGWNVFDFFIVSLSFLELVLDGVKGLSVLRTFRLLRVFKLAKSWQTLNMLISIVARTMGALGNLTFVLGIVIFIFAVMGQQLFASYYDLYLEPEFGAHMPRWNFKDFLHSFMIVFRVLCGEWIESMWGCVRVAGAPCVPFFLLTFVIGNLVVLNLFLALLLAAFGTDNLQTEGGEEEAAAPNKLAEAFNRFSRFGNWVKVHMIVIVKRTKESKRPLPVTVDSNTHVDADGKNGAIVADGNVIINGKVCEMTLDDTGQVTPSSKPELNGDTVDGLVSEPSTRTPSRSSEKERRSAVSDTDASTVSDECETQSLKKIDADGEPEINEVDVEFAEYPDDCFCSICKRKCACCIRVENSSFGQWWWKIRCFMFKVTQHKYFETFIITMILISSLALACEDVNLPNNPILKEILKYLDLIFTVVFFLEMLVKWVAFGWKHYFTDAWCWLDFVIVAISLIMVGALIIGAGEMPEFKAMRTLRALRPLRAVSRWEGMRVVVNALIKAIPSIFHVLLVCLVFWLIFGIVGVQFFAGKFYKCLDDDDVRLPLDVVKNESHCIAQNYTWVNSAINFDNVLNAYLALFQVATYKGWVEIIGDSVDAPAEVGLQPDNEINQIMYLYYVLFIIFGSFFTLNLFIGVIIENFNQQKKKAGGSLEMFMTEDQKKYYKAMKRMQSKSPIKAIPRPNAGSLEMFMTEDQKKYYNAMKRMQSKSPQKSIPRPTWFPGNIMFDITTNQKFDIFIMVIIMLNMITMTLDHHNMEPSFESIVSNINTAFIVIFTVECVMKLLGLRHFYFKIPWNVFDFIVVILSILSLTLSGYIEKYFVSPTLLRVVRVFRVSRVLRLVKSAKGIRTLLFSFAVSLPALFNIGLLLFLVLFIYAIFGMNFFKGADISTPGDGLDDVFNFQTFGQSIITLFQMCTSAGWNGVLSGLMACDMRKNYCANYSMAVLYLISYLIISFLVVVNMYIAVILENFSQATEDVQQGLTPDDFDMYYEKWEKYDPEATQYIALEQLSDFVDFLESPLQLQKPNYFMLVKLDIPIFEGDVCNCRDILDALTKNFLGTSDTGDIPAETEAAKSKIELSVISSTLLRQKEHYAARIIQKAFRNYRCKHGGPDDKPPPPPYEEVAIPIPTEENENDREQEDKNQDTEFIELQNITNESQSERETESEEKEKSEEETSATNTEDSHTIVEVDLKPDSDVVA